MSMSILAILISLAMMLTGVGGEGQPAEAAKTLVLHDINLSVGDEDFELTPELRMGAYSNGEKAVFDVAMDLDGERLFPVQLGVDDSGITALFEKSDVAVKVSSEALEAMTEQYSQMLQQMTTQGENAELMTYIMNEYIPAYVGLIEAAQDEKFADALQVQGNAVFAQVIDRGEGTPVTETIDGADYALMEYNYTIDAAKMAELIDTLFTSNDKLNAYYEAMFKMFDMVPAESGLNGISSYADLFGKMNVAMTMEVNEKLSDDGEIDIMDAVLSIDMSGMISAQTQAQYESMLAQMQATLEEGEEMPEVEAPEAVELPPMMFDIQSSQVGEVKHATVAFDYEYDGQRVTLAMTGDSEGRKNASMEMDMAVNDGEEDVGSLGMSATFFTDEATGDTSYMVVYDVTADDVSIGISADGIAAADGTSQNAFAIAGENDSQSFALSFGLDVTADAIEDKANGHEAALEIDDLSEEAMNALSQDQAFVAAMMQVSGSMMGDYQKLIADESVQNLMGLFTAAPAEDVTYVEDDGSYDEDGESDDYEYEYDYDYEDEVEDDGVLNYEIPEFTWLPEGWQIANTETDTAYDWVSMTLADENGDESAYATFFEDMDEEQTNYVVGEDGSIEAVEGREITLSSYEDTMSVTLHEANLYGNIAFINGGVDVETIGRIVAGIQF